MALKPMAYGLSRLIPSAAISFPARHTRSWSTRWPSPSLPSSCHVPGWIRTNEPLLSSGSENKAEVSINLVPSCVPFLLTSNTPTKGNQVYSKRTQNLFGKQGVRLVIALARQCGDVGPRLSQPADLGFGLLRHLLHLGDDLLQPVVVVGYPIHVADLGQDQDDVELPPPIGVVTASDHGIWRQLLQVVS